jgi:hypothetical protein
MVAWIKTHKLISFLLLVIIFLLVKNNFNFPSLQTSTRSGLYKYSGGIDSAQPVGEFKSLTAPSVSQYDASNEAVSATSRMVIQESNMSLLVKDVRDSGDKILAFTKNNGGYMVYASYTRPSENPFATITVRVPTNKLDQSLKYFKSLAIKVTNENLDGTDITDQYTDIEARLATLKKTQAKFEEILDKATKIQDILEVQREIINLQAQIDSYVGQQKAMEKNAEMTKIVIYLSTDEIALPYTPDNVFRPDVTFKYAVRSLLTNLTKVAEASIWIIVYLPVIIIVVLIYIFVRKWLKKRNQSPR